MTSPSPAIPDLGSLIMIEVESSETRPLPRPPPDCCSLTSHSRSPPPPGQTLGVMTSGDDDLMEGFKRC